MTHSLWIATMLLMLTASMALADDAAAPPITASSTDAEITNIINEAIEKKELQRMREIGETLRQLFRDTDPERFIKLSLRLSSALNTFDFGSRKQYEVASSLALAALTEVSDETPLSTELDLCTRLRSQTSGGDEKGGPDEARRTLMKHWVHGVRRLKQVAEIELNEADAPKWANSPPPGFEHAVSKSGGLPADPEVRRRYEAAVALRAAKAASFYEQEFARERRPRYEKRFEEFVIEAYAGAVPANPDELRDFLDAAHVSAVDQDRIRSAISKISHSE